MKVYEVWRFDEFDKFYNLDVFNGLKVVSFKKNVGMVVAMSQLILVDIKPKLLFAYFLNK